MVGCVPYLLYAPGVAGGSIDAAGWDPSHRQTVPKRLAEIVIDAGLASRDVVLEAARVADKQRMPLVAALVHHGGVDDLALIAAIKRQVRVAIADPALVQNDPEAMRELPHEICRRLRVMPLSISLYDTGSRILRLAMADPTDAIAVAEVEHVTGCQVESALMPLSAVEELVDKSYRSFITEVMPRERTEPTPGLPAGDAPEATPGTEPDKKAGKKPGKGPGKRPGKQPGNELDPAQPSTVPFHRISDEATLEVRHRALLNLLLDKELIAEQEYEEHIRLLMKQRDGDG